jgi:phage shock protein C
MSQRLYRSRGERMLAGVCGGLAEYFNVDPTLVRVVYLVVTVLTGVLSGLVLYVVLAVMMPESPSPGSDESAPPSVAPLFSAGLILVVLGALLLVANYGLLAWWAWTRMWPVIIIVAGLILIARRRS